MSGYTKGPWTFTGVFIEDRKGHPVATTTMQDNEEANAFLIAAAPDLYEEHRELNSY